MDFEVFEIMYQYFFEFIYKILEIFGITVGEDGNLTDGE